MYVHQKPEPEVLEYNIICWNIKKDSAGDFKTALLITLYYLKKRITSLYSLLDIKSSVITRHGAQLVQRCKQVLTLHKHVASG